MSGFPKLSEYDFGDYSGFREYLRNPDLFLNSFIPPESFALDKLRNNGKFIVVGKKGTGKSTCCQVLAHRRREEGYKTAFYHFDELTRKDAVDALKSQKILDLKQTDTKRLFDNIVDFYDFRDLWKRKVLLKIRSELFESGISSPFIDLLGSISISESSLSDGVGRGLELPTASIGKKFLDRLQVPSSAKSMSLKSYVDLGLRLLAESHKKIRGVFFFDELNISYAASKSDEYNTKLFLIRDLVRAAAELNDFFVACGLDVTVICCLRPEVRNAIIHRENELSKIIEPNSVNLVWPTNNSTENPLFKLLLEKVRFGAPKGANVDPMSLFPDMVLNEKEGVDVPILQYILNMTWYRPRDIIKILDTYQEKNGSRTKFFTPDSDQDSFLRAYARVSQNDLIAELEVKYQRSTIVQAFQKIGRPKFRHLDDFILELEPFPQISDMEEFVRDLFDAGVIINMHKESGRSFVVAAFQDDEELNPNLQILIHRALQPRMQFRDLGGSREF